ncbi:hypothetical protein [Paenibacillus sp. FSL R7-0333]|uniref:hypothetical protein n=1 Tax=Paenibacillus sp. FSL R7-0333 TaxID=1926587 RepID=UPI00096FDB19|nr:hypothetical protein BK146_16970 [Paenibacillus sp. FSL R7-0333]
MSVLNDNLDTKKTLAVMNRLFQSYLTQKYIDQGNHSSSFCAEIEKAVDGLDGPEKQIIQERYMKSAYVKDYQVFNFSLDPPLSSDTYKKYRRRAFFKLVVVFNRLGYLDIEKIRK